MKALPLLLLLSLPLHAQRQTEDLGRGVVAMRTGNDSTYVSWRMLGSDEDDISFNLYRRINGGAGVKLNGAPLVTTTDYQDSPGSGALNGSPVGYYVRPVIDGSEQPASATYTLPTNAPIERYFEIPFTTDPGPDGPYDTKFAWVGDFDADGEYDFLCDRLSTLGANEQFLEAYLQDGTFLWRMHMGPTSAIQSDIYRPGAAAISTGDGDNVTCFDLDGDNHAEAIVRTANGVSVTNASGTTVTQITAPNDTDQFLTVIDGMTGAEINSAPVPNDWSQHGTLQSKCFIAYLDGKNPSIILYGYNRASNGTFYRQWTAWDYVAGSLVQRWTWAQDPAVHPGSEGHQIRIADVDNDGRDELVDIGHVMDDDGTQLYVTELTHGDRFHVADINPLRPGLETFAIQQNNPTFLATAYMKSGDGFMHDKWYAAGLVDVGRGLTADIDQNHLGMEMFSTQPNIYNAEGEVIHSNHPFPYEGLWWDGDTGREFIAGANGTGTSPIIDKFNPATGGNNRLYSVYNDGVRTSYGGRPAFWGDILGDWREELVLVRSDYSGLRLFTTTTPADDRRRTLMHNAQYRVQTTTKGYVQASYVDYYLGFETTEDPPQPIDDTDHTWVGTVPTFDATTCPPGDSILFDLSGNNASPVVLTGTLIPSKVKVFSPIDYTFDGALGSLSGDMDLLKSGAGSLHITGSHSYTGSTEVWDGALVIDGSLDHSPVTIHGGIWGAPLARGETGGRLGGSGTIDQAVTLAWRGAITPGNGNGDPATLTLNGGLTCGEHTTLSLDISDSGPSDLIAISGDLTLQGTTTLVIHSLAPSLAPATHNLITYTGNFNGSLDAFEVDLPVGTPYTLTDSGGVIQLTIPVTRPSASIHWQGGGNGNAWDLFDTPNFLLDSDPTTFVSGDDVTFDDSGLPNTAVILDGPLSIGDVLVDSSLDYEFSGSGSLTGAGSLTKAGSGTLTIEGDHSFNGPVVLQGGILSVTRLADGGQPSSLGAADASPGNLVLDGGTLRHDGAQTGTNRGIRIEPGGGTLHTPGHSLQLGGTIEGPGALTKSGDGLLIIGGTNSYSGGTFIDDGTLQLASDGANASGLGPGPITFRGGTLSMTDNSGSYNSASYDIIVPAGQSGRLNADSRVYLGGTLSGSGDFTFYTPFVRTDLQGDWSGFTGNLIVVADGDGGDLRIDNTHGFGGSAVDLGPDVWAYYKPTMFSDLTLELGALSGDPAANLLGGPTSGRTLTWRIGGRNTDSTYQGSIADGTSTTALTKTGSGVLTLSGAASHTGDTVVEEGTLRLEGTSSGSDFSIQAGGNLGGTGTITGNLTIATGGGLELNCPSIVGDVSLGSNLVIRSTTNPGPGTHLVGTFTGNTSGDPSVAWAGPGTYAATLSTSGGELNLTLTIPPGTDDDHDMLPDFWELTYFASIDDCHPLDDGDGDGFNNWIEWKADTDPTNGSSIPNGTTLNRSTADGTGFDGALCEVNYSGAYDGGFYTDDQARFRNNCYQNPGVRHYLTVLKFDLSPWAGQSVTEASLNLFVNGSSYQALRTLSLYQGDDSFITPAIGYNAANPFIDDSYTAETDTDTDFEPGTVTTLLTYENGPANTPETIGAGDTGLLAATQSTLDGDGILTLIIHGGASQYLTQADEDPHAANRPTLYLRLPDPPNPDEDSDGLADAWEAQNFGTLAHSATDDNDADGSPNWLEQALDLDPNDPNQRFTAGIESDGLDGLLLTWPNGPDIHFTVESSADLTPPWIEETSIPGSSNPPRLEHAITPSADARFFRVKAAPSP